MMMINLMAFKKYFPHRFKVINQCNLEGESSGRNERHVPKVVVMVTSKYDHFAVRQTHRKHLNQTLLRKWGIKRFFVVGNPPPDGSTGGKIALLEDRHGGHVLNLALFFTY